MKKQNLYLTIFIPLLLGLAGCTTGNPVEPGFGTSNKIEQTHEQNVARAQLIQSWTGRLGYLLIPPTFKTSSAFSVEDPDQFHRCDKVQIKKINYAFPDNEYTIFLEQNQKQFAIVGFAGDVKNSDSSARPRGDLWNLTDYFSDQLPRFQPATVKTATGTVNARDLACQGRFWKGMTKDEFIFVLGPPASVTKKIENGKTIEQYDLRVPSPGSSATYWFEDNLLRDWRR